MATLIHDLRIHRSTNTRLHMLTFRLAHTAQTITSLTGDSLKWTLMERANATSGTAEVWQAVATAPVSAATISATFKNKSCDGSITVAAFKGAGSTVGAVATNSAG